MLIGIAVTNPALAYIGPGTGITAIGTVLAVAAAVLLLIVGFVWYPARRLLRSRKAPKNAKNESADPKKLTKLPR